MTQIIDISHERLARRAPTYPLALDETDHAYILANLDEIGESFQCRARPDVSLSILPARSLVRYLIYLEQNLPPETLEQRLAIGRLESIFRLVATAIALSEAATRRTA